MGYKGLELDQKVAVVVGGTSGIGRAIAIGLAQAGAHVVPTARRESLVKQTVQEIILLGRNSISVTSDVENRKSLESMVKKVIKKFGQIDILVNSAGRTLKVPTVDMKEKDWDAILETNLTGVMRSCQVVGRQMIKQKSGRIINIASLASYVSLSQVTAYCVSKSGVAMLTKCLACEWAPYGINVNAIAPGVFRTSLNTKLLDGTQRGHDFIARTPKGRFGKVEELAGAAIFLSSPAAEFVTGEVLTIDGGYLSFGV